MKLIHTTAAAVDARLRRLSVDRQRRHRNRRRSLKQPNPTGSGKLAA